jgi:hypothetical protein
VTQARAAAFGRSDEPPPGGRRYVDAVATEKGTSAARPAGMLDPSSPLPVYVGVAVIALGAALVGYTWLRVSGLLSVPLQLPYVASSGFTGLGLVIVGALVTSLAAKRRDADERRRQLEEVALVLAALSTALDSRRPA